MWTAMLELAPSSTGPSTDRDVVGQIKLAFAHPLPLVIGALIGALVPIATYTVGHAELGEAGWASLPGAIVAGGLLFSAITVYKWGRRAFGGAVKAVGFVVLSEGVMSFSHTPWLSILVLGFLVAINAIANGANLAVAHLDAEARRAATAAATLAVAAPASPSVATAVLVEARVERLEAELTRLATAPTLAPTPVPALAAPAVATPDSESTVVAPAAPAAPAAPEPSALMAKRRTRVKVAKSTRARRAPDPDAVN